LPFARIALQVSRAVLPRYRTRFSKRQFTQPQLLAILCLMRYEDWTFREAEVRLSEHRELRQVLGLVSVPDFTTLYRFLQRLDDQTIDRAVGETVRRLRSSLRQKRKRARVAVDATHNSLVTIANGSDKIARAQLTILYNHGSGQYQLEQTLAPDEQMALDFGKLIHDQVPDKNGHFLPPGLTEGTYRLLDLNENPVGSLYEGKEIVDKTYGHASYTCMI
jgi:hypothetical protein